MVHLQNKKQSKWDTVELLIALGVDLMLPFFIQYLLRAWFLNKAIASLMKDELRTQYLGNKREGAINDGSFQKQFNFLCYKNAS